MSSQRLSLIILAIACACGPGQPNQTSADSADATSATTDGASGTTASTTPDPTTGPAATGTAATVPDTTDGPDDSGPDATSTPGNPTVSTTPTPDTGDPITTSTTFPETTGEVIPCELHEQNCPEGQKCSVVAMSADDLFQGTFQCVPLHPDPVPPHAACDVFGDPADGTDNCELGSICLFPDDAGIGECFAFCNFASRMICPAGDFCIGATCQSCTWSFCDSPCDLLDPATCNPGDVCSPAGDIWTCTFDASGDLGQHGDPCMFVNSCDPGHACVDSQLTADCGGDGCCAAACDLTAPDCPAATTCKPWYADGTAPTDELAELGVCVE